MLLHYPLRVLRAYTGPQALVKHGVILGQISLHVLASAHIPEQIDDVVHSVPLSGPCEVQTGTLRQRVGAEQILRLRTPMYQGPMCSAGWALIRASSSSEAGKPGIQRWHRTTEPSP